jgi:hypothetical protein
MLQPIEGMSIFDRMNMINRMDLIPNPADPVHPV